LAVRIRLTRVGATKRPAYRVVAIDRRRARDGRALEILGFYDPLTEPATVRLETEKIRAWIGKGAQPSETVVKLMRQVENAATAQAAAAKPARATASAARPTAAPTRTTAAAARPKSTRKPRAEKAESAQTQTAEGGIAEVATADGPTAEGQAAEVEGAEVSEAAETPKAEA
jgi:small subunit ribosomal protein S16